jgi:hypothetical protein
MAKKFIPDGDRDFAHMASAFAEPIERDPVRYQLSTLDAALISEAVQAYRDALAQALRRVTRTKCTIMTKDRVRAKTERLLRKYANRIRINDAVDPVDKKFIFVKERPKRLKRRRCPMRPPHVRFLGTATGPATKQGMHLLEFREEQFSRSRAKPNGAVRLELFVGLVGPGEQPPRVPGDATKGPVRSWYVRSFTTNPIRVKHPVPPSPMLVVYWARWADATGDVGEFSPPVRARIEGVLDGLWGQDESDGQVRRAA